MGYMHEIDRWLDGLLAALPEDARESAKREIRAKLLESYRNGQAASRGAGTGKGRTEKPTKPNHGR